MRSSYCWDDPDDTFPCARHRPAPGSTGDRRVSVYLLVIPRDAEPVSLQVEGNALRSAVPVDAPLVVGQDESARVRWLASPDAVVQHGQLVVAVAGLPEVVRRREGHAAVSEPTTARGIAERWTQVGAQALDELVGGYAIAVWEADEQRLTLETDEFGLNSLFLRQERGAWYVCTEVVPLLSVGAPTRLDTDALPDLIAARFLSSHRTVWQGIRHIPQRRRCVVSPDGSISERNVSRFSYQPPSPPPRFDASVDALHQAMRENLGRLRDSGVSEVVVPLSGGVDSSLMAALSAQIFPRCTAVTFEIEAYENPELPRARAVAERLGIPFQVAQVSMQDVARTHPWIMGRLQEPPLHFNNPPFVRMLELCREIAPDVISGDFDSLYGTNVINRVRLQRARRRWVSWLPPRVANTLASTIRQSGSARRERLADLLEFDLPQLIHRSRVPRLTAEAALALPPAARTGAPSAELIARTFEPDWLLEDAAQLWNMRYVTNAVVRRNTRFADALGLRIRYPLVDVAALDIVQSLTYDLRWDEARSEGKPLLHALCAEVVGLDVARWSKFGFPSPELSWMEGPLLDRLTASLADDAPLAPYLDLAQLRALPRAPNHQTLWTVMTLDEVLRQGAAAMSIPQPA